MIVVIIANYCHGGELNGTRILNESNKVDNNALLRHSCMQCQ